MYVSIYVYVYIYTYIHTYAHVCGIYRLHIVQYKDTSKTEVHSRLQVRMFSKQPFTGSWYDKSFNEMGLARIPKLNRIRTLGIIKT